MKRKMIVCMLAMIATCMSGHEVVSEELTCERNGLNIYGVMYRPDTQGRLPAVVLSHSSSLTHAAMAGYAEKLAADGISAKVINIHTIKPIDRELIVKSVSKTGKAVTVEEHSINGGLGSAVAEVLCEEQPAKLLRIGVEDRFGESGPAVELIHKYGLDAEGIYSKVKNYMK